MSTWLSSVVTSVLTRFGLQRIGPNVSTALPAKDTRAIEHVHGAIYPPRDPGLPIRVSHALVADHADLFQMLRLHAAESEDRFAVRFHQPIQRLAALINTLPATPSHAFSGSGGLLRASVETAFNAFRASDGRIFTGALGVEDRHKLEGRWRYVCYVAGLLYPVGASLAAMNVLDSKGGKWSPEIEGLEAWAGSVGADRVFVSWVSEAVAPGPASVTGTFALTVIGRSNLDWLNEGAPDLVRTLLDIVSGSKLAAKDAIAPVLVRDIWTAVQERETARRHQNYGRLTIGSHVSPYLLDALVGLSKSRWAFNKNVMFVDKTGVYLQWPEAGQHIAEYCQSHGYAGVPLNDQALLSLMVSNGIVVAGVDRIALHEIAGDSGEVVMAAKLKHHDLVIPDGTTLEAIAGDRRVLMSDIRARDPLHKAEQALEGAIPKVVKPQAATAPPASPLKFDEIDPADVLGMSAPADVNSGAAEPPDEGDSGYEEAHVPVDSAMAAPPPAPSQPAKASVLGAPQQPRQLAKASQPGAGGLVEAPEIRYSELLPEEVASKFKSVDAELLGRLVHVWRKKAADGKVMRVCEQGVAFDLTLLAEYTTDPVGFLNTLGTQGYLFSERSTPGKMIYQVAATEGSRKTATCFILLHHAAKKLGIP